MAAEIEVNAQTIKDIPLIKANQCPEEIKKMILDYGLLFKIASASKTEITFNKSHLDEVKNALKQCKDIGPELQVIQIDSNHKGFDFPREHKKGPWIRFRETGKKSAGTANKTATDIGINIDDAREIGVGVCTCLILNNVSKSDFLDSKYNNSVFKNLETSANLDKVFKFLILEPEKFEAAWNCGETIINNFKKFTKEPISNFIIHHKTKEFNEIKRIGKNLSKLNEDKWNPADLFFILKNSSILNKLSKYKNYQEYNDYIGGNTDIIGVSLKESREGALHGAVSGQQFCKFLIGDQSFARIQKINAKKYNDNLPKVVHEFFKKLKKISNIVDVKVLVKDIKNPEDQMISVMKQAGQGLDVKTSKNKPLSSNYFTSISGCLAVYSELFDYSEYKLEKLTNIFKLAFEYAESKLSQSCPYEKILGKEYEHMGNEPAVAKIENICIPCDGESQFIVNLTYNGHTYKFQLRSKNTTPQFIVVPGAFIPTGYKSL